MAGRRAAKPEQPFELNKSALRALLRDMLKSEVDENDERIVALYSMPFVQHPLAVGELPGPTKDRQVFQAIDRLWLSEMRPGDFIDAGARQRLKAFTGKHARQWIKFLYPEYILFYPLRHSKAQPASVADASIAMGKVETLALIITNGDYRKAEDLEFDQDSRSALDRLVVALSENGAATNLEKTVDMRIARILDELVTLIHRHNRDHATPAEPFQPVPEIAQRSPSTEVEKTSVTEPLVSDRPESAPSSEQQQSPARVVSQDRAASVQPEFSALEAYWSILDRKYPALTSYVPPTFTLRVSGKPEESASTPALDELMDEYRTVVIAGGTGMGKTALLTQGLLPAARRLGLLPVVVSLPEYIDGDTVGDVRGFVIKTIFAAWYPDVREQEAFERELAKARRDQRVVWFLDGYDELMPVERLQAVRDIEQLDRFVLTTRKTRPTLSRNIEAHLELDKMVYADALGFVEAEFSLDARNRLEQWLRTNDESRRILECGIFLDAAARIASDPAPPLSLYAILDQAIYRLLSRARFQSTSDTDLVERICLALGDLALASLDPRFHVTSNRNRFATEELLSAWRRNHENSESAFIEVITSTGLLIGDGDQWEFFSDLIRDTLAAQFMDKMKLTLTARRLYPQYQRVFALWTDRLARAGQHQRIADVLAELILQGDDPYGARWSTVVRVLAECMPSPNADLQRLGRETEQALLEMWRSTSSNRMKEQIRSYLLRLRSARVPDPIADDLEYVLPDIENSVPELDLPEVLSRIGHENLVHLVGSQAYADERTIIFALLDALAQGDETLTRAAAIHLTHFSFASSPLDQLRGNTTISRVAASAETRPVSNFATNEALQRARLAQSAVLAVLARPDVLSDKALLDRLPDGGIHTLMATVGLRIRMEGKSPIVITVEGREWPARSSSGYM